MSEPSLYIILCLLGISAALRYYYHVDSALEGGDMEFCGREPLDVLAIADAGDNTSSFDKASLKKALVDNKIRCRVPICEGGAARDLCANPWLVVLRFRLVAGRNVAGVLQSPVGAPCPSHDQQERQ